MSKLLIDDYPIQVLPKLAEKIGLNEAIILQQMHYWLNSSKHEYDGKRWIYNSYSNWQKQFPFWSERTIKRTFSSLEKQKLLFVGNYNKAGFDRTKWYSVNYEELDKLVARAWGQNGTMERDKMALCNGTKWHYGTGQNDPTNTIDYAETNSENTTKINNNNNAVDKPPHVYVEIIDYLNKKTGIKFNHKAQKNRSVIKARLNEGYTIDDFKKVIDNKTKQWLNNPKMKDYLRPSTLFSGKFENYLHESPKTNGFDMSGINAALAELDAENIGGETNANDTTGSNPTGYIS